MQNKKGLSAIVGTLLIILLVIIAVGIVWAVLQNTLDDSSSEVEFTSLQLSLDLEKAVVDTTVSGSELLNVTVKRRAGGGDLSAVLFVVSDDSNSESYQNVSTMAELDRVTFSIPINQSIFNSDFSEINKVEIYPMVAQDGTNVAGSLGDSYVPSIV